MVVGENKRVDGVIADPLRGLQKAPAVCLRRTVEVTPTEMGIRAAGDPGSRRRLRIGGDGAEEDLRAGVVRAVTHPPVKQAVLDLPDPSQTAPENWTASCVITGHLVAALRGYVEFQTADHSACLQEGQTEVWRRGQQRAEEALTSELEGALVLHARRL